MNMTSGVFAASILCSTLRALLLGSLWNSLMPRRLSKFPTYAILWGLYVFLDFLIPVFVFRGVSQYLLFLLYYCVVFLFVFFLYKGTVLARTVYFFLGLSLFAIISPLVTVLFSLLPDRLRYILNHPLELESVLSMDFWGYALAMTGQFSLEALLAHFALGLYKRVRFKEAMPSQAKFMLVPASQFVLIMTCIIFGYNNGMVAPEMDPYIVIIFFAAAVICISADLFLFFTLRDMDKKAELELQLRLMEQSQLSDYEQYKTVDNLYRREREFRHDINNKLITAQSLLNQGATQELSAFLQEISGTVARHRYVEYCENSLINTVLNNKIDMARFLGIQVETETWVGKLSLPGTELCSLFSNILDNAVEACKALPPEREKRIRLTVRVQNSYLIVSCKNTALHGPEERKDTAGPGKKVSDRGWGLGILNRMAQQYDGELRTEFSEGWFSLRIILKLEQSSAQ